LSNEKLLRAGFGTRTVRDVPCAAASSNFMRADAVSSTTIMCSRSAAWGNSGNSSCQLVDVFGSSDVHTT